MHISGARTRGRLGGCVIKDSHFYGARISGGASPLLVDCKYVPHGRKGAMELPAPPFFRRVGTGATLPAPPFFGGEGRGGAFPGNR